MDKWWAVLCEKFNFLCCCGNIRFESISFHPYKLDCKRVSDRFVSSVHFSVELFNSLVYAAEAKTAAYLQVGGGGSLIPSWHRNSSGVHRPSGGCWEWIEAPGSLSLPLQSTGEPKGVGFRRLDDSHWSSLAAWWAIPLPSACSPPLSLCPNAPGKPSIYQHHVLNRVPANTRGLQLIWFMY